MSLCFYLSANLDDNDTSEEVRCSCAFRIYCACTRFSRDDDVWLRSASLREKMCSWPIYIYMKAALNKRVTQIEKVFAPLCIYVGIIGGISSGSHGLYVRSCKRCSTASRVLSLIFRSVFLASVIGKSRGASTVTDHGLTRT